MSAPTPGTPTRGAAPPPGAGSGASWRRLPFWREGALACSGRAGMLFREDRDRERRGSGRFLCRRKRKKKFCLSLTTRKGREKKIEKTERPAASKPASEKKSTEVTLLSVFFFVPSGKACALSLCCLCHRPPSADCPLREAALSTCPCCDRKERAVSVCSQRERRPSIGAAVAAVDLSRLSPPSLPLQPKLSYSARPFLHSRLHVERSFSRHLVPRSLRIRAEPEPSRAEKRERAFFFLSSRLDVRRDAVSSVACRRLLLLDFTCPFSCRESRACSLF